MYDLLRQPYNRIIIPGAHGLRGLGVDPSGGGGMSQQALVDKFNADINKLTTSWGVRGAVAEYNRYSGMLSMAYDLYKQIGRITDAASVFKLLETIGNLASMIGPVGVLASTFLRVVSSISETLLSAFPAYTAQLQKHDYLYLSRLFAQGVLGIDAPSGTDAGMIMASMGWIPVFVIGGEDFCKGSGGQLSNWTTRPGIVPSTIEENVALFASIAGPRTKYVDSLGTRGLSALSHSVKDRPSTFCEDCDLSRTGYADWIETDYGARSFQKGLDLANHLAPGGFIKQSPWIEGGESGSATYIGKNLIFFNNVRYDINPSSYRERNTWLNGFLIRVTALPDELLFPLGTLLMLTAEKTEILHGALLSGSDKTRILNAAFGPPAIADCVTGDIGRDSCDFDLSICTTRSGAPCSSGNMLWNRKFLDSNLLWILYQQYWRNSAVSLTYQDTTTSTATTASFHDWIVGYSFDAAGPAIVAEMGARARPTTDEPWSTGEKVVAVVGGLTALGLLGWGIYALTK